MLKWHNHHKIEWFRTPKATAEDWQRELMCGTSSSLGATDIPDDVVGKQILFVGASSIEHIINLTLNGTVTVLDFNPDQIEVAKFYLEHPEALTLRMLYTNLRQSWDQLTHQGVTPPPIEDPGNINVVVGMARAYLAAKIDPTTDENRVASEFLKSLCETYNELKQYHRSFVFRELARDSRIKCCHFDGNWADKCLDHWQAKAEELKGILEDKQRRQEFVRGIRLLWPGEQGKDELVGKVEAILRFYDLTKQATGNIVFAGPVDIADYAGEGDRKFDYMVFPDLGPSTRDYKFLRGFIPYLAGDGRIILTDVYRAFECITNLRQMIEDVGYVRVDKSSSKLRVPLGILSRNAMEQYLANYRIPLRVEEFQGGCKQTTPNPHGMDFYAGQWASAYSDVMHFCSSSVRFVLVKK